MSVKHGVPDLLYVFKVAEFMYTLYSIPDNLYGVYDHETKEWNGIVRELIDGGYCCGSNDHQFCKVVEKCVNL